MANLCQTLHVLPRPGSLFDQDPTEIRMLQTVFDAQAEKEELELKKAQAKHASRRP